MATNLVYRNTDAKNRVQDLGETLAPGTPVLSEEILPAVAVTGSGDYVTSESIYGMTLSNIDAAGVGLDAQEVTLAFDGTWEFPEADVANITAAGMVNGDAIYAAGSTAGAATLTDVSTANTLFGYIDIPKDYDRTRGMVPIRIGA